MSNSVPIPVLEFVLDDYQENTLYNGDQPCPSPDELRQYWDRFVSDSASWDRPVPEGLTPDLYVAIWNSEYQLRTGKDPYVLPEPEPVPDQVPVPVPQQNTPASTPVSGIKYVVVFAIRSSGTQFTCEAFPCEGRSAEESLTSCINYHLYGGKNTLVSIAPAPLTGEEDC